MLSTFAKVYTGEMKKKITFLYLWKFLGPKLLSHKVIKNKDKYKESYGPKTLVKLRWEKKEQLKLVNDPLAWTWLKFYRNYSEMLSTGPIGWIRRYLVKTIQSEWRIGKMMHQSPAQTPIVKNGTT